MRALILSGSGRSADPWHPFHATSAAIGRVAEDAGLAASIVDGPLEGLAALAEARGLDALAAIVVNAGDHLTPLPEGAVDPGPPGAELLAAAEAGLRGALDAGVGLLGVHAAASTLRELPSFGAALGARWVRDESWHPPFGRLRVEPAEPPVAPPFDAPQAFEAPGPFDVLDERYSALRFAGDAIVIARCVDAEGVHPLVTARREGAARVVYSALGHDERSFTSAAHRVLLANALRWIARR